MRVSVEAKGLSFLDGAKAIVVFDGECVLCNRSIATLLRLDRHRKLRIASRASAVGQRILGAMGSAASEYDSIVVLSRGAVHIESDAMIEIAIALGFPYAMFASFRVIPTKFRDRMYSWVARNRYRWFGRTQECALIAPELRDRFLKDIE